MSADTTIVDCFNIDEYEPLAKDLAKAYPIVLYDIANEMVPGLDFYVSTNALQVALREFCVDIRMLKLRRENPCPSWGKLAGILTFRLVRHQVSQPSCQKGIESKKARMVPILAAIGLSLKQICQVDFDKSVLPPMLTTELIYTVYCRHMNQETLGLCYDTLVINKQ